MLTWARREVVVGLGVVALAVVASGCSSVQAPFVPPLAGTFTMVTAPLDVDYASTDVGAEQKKGEASSVCVLGLVAVGDAGTQAAARAGGLKVVKHADYRYLNVLGVFQRVTVIVYGE